METKMNIVTILKDKPKNTKLYSPIFGDMYFSGVENDIIKVIHQGKIVIFFGDGRYYNYPESEPLLFPSKEMHDWEKFSWKKGDVLIMNGCRVVFDKWLNDDYTRFNAVHLQNRYTPISNFITKYWRKITDLETKIYMESLEREYDGKLNLTTLNIEKQLEFKDGDIVVAEEDNYYDKVIFIATIKDDIVSKALINARYEDYGVHYNEYRFGHNRSLRLATDSEKQQLFDALEKEGKAWDAKKKQIVDLKPKVELKPFDRVLVRDSKSDEWCANLFSYKNVNEPYYCVYASWNYCIPYEGNEHLLGTKNNPK
jgi:hypothetical protein